MSMLRVRWRMGKLGRRSFHESEACSGYEEDWIVAILSVQTLACDN
jgi:hypothetical protein